MAHGTPDYGPTAALKTVYTALDFAELAARLGSPVTFDRRGNIIWFDDFSGSLCSWKRALSGAASSAEITNLHSRSGAFSVECITHPTANRSAGLTHTRAVPVLSRIGFELSFSMCDNNWQLELLTNLDTGTERHEANIVWDEPTRLLNYYGNDSLYHEFGPAIPLDYDLYCFNTLKIVLDYTTYKYVRAILNGVSIDMSAYTYRHLNIVASPNLHFSIVTRTQEAAVKTMYLDDVIITQNEP